MKKGEGGKRESGGGTETEEEEIGRINLCRKKEKEEIKIKWG